MINGPVQRLGGARVGQGNGANQQPGRGVSQLGPDGLELRKRQSLIREALATITVKPLNCRSPPAERRTSTTRVGRCASF